VVRLIVLSLEDSHRIPSIAFTSFPRSVAVAVLAAIEKSQCFLPLILTRITLSLFRLHRRPLCRIRSDASCVLSYSPLSRQIFHSRLHSPTPFSWGFSCRTILNGNERVSGCDVLIEEEFLPRDSLLCCFCRFLRLGRCAPSSGFPSETPNLCDGDDPPSPLHFPRASPLRLVIFPLLSWDVAPYTGATPLHARVSRQFPPVSLSYA